MRAWRAKRNAKNKALWEPLKNSNAGKLMKAAGGEDFVLTWPEVKQWMTKNGKSQVDIQNAFKLWIKGMKQH